jgi:hypothetical protein
LNLQNRSFTFRPALLQSESAEEFAALLEELNQDIRPRDIIERMYVNDIATLTWDILRYRRAKAGMLNTVFMRAQVNVLRPLFFGGAHLEMSDKPARDLVDRSLYDPEAADRISNLLKEAKLDDSAAEAEALRLRLSEIEKIERLIASAESRRHKALRNIALYEEGFAGRLQSESDRLLDAKAVPTVAPPYQ